MQPMPTIGADAMLSRCAKQNTVIATPLPPNSLPVVMPLARSAAAAGFGATAGFEIAAAGFAAALVVGAFAAGFAGAFVGAEEWRVVRVVGIVNRRAASARLEFTRCAL